LGREIRISNILEVPKNHLVHGSILLEKENRSGHKNMLRAGKVSAKSFKPRKFSINSY
jgi:hypothetical protein